jgi:DNA-binding ferritin-like protein
MENLACLFRAAQLYGHAAHHQAHGQTSYQDHAAFAELYAAYEEAYDDTIEQMIGLQMSPDIAKITTCACEKANSLADPALFKTEVSFGVLMQLELAIQGEIAAIYDASDIGTQNMLAQFAQDSQHRANYKIGQRLKQ